MLGAVPLLGDKKAVIERQRNRKKYSKLMKRKIDIFLQKSDEKSVLGKRKADKNTEEISKKKV